MSYKKIHQFDFSDGVQIPLNKINMWHTGVLEKLVGNADYASHSSGNSIVIGRKDKNGLIIIYEITNGYKLFEYEPNKEPNVQASVATESDSSNQAD